MLEIEFGFHITQKDHDLQRLHIRAGGDHVYRDGYTRIVIVAKGPDQRLRVGAVSLIGDLFGKIVALAENLADDLRDLLGVVIVFREDQGFRHFSAAGKQFREQRVAIGLEDGTDLIGYQH